MVGVDLVLGVLGLGAGWIAWGFVEYAVHGLLSHRWKTFVSPLHWGHHREPRAVFTSPLAWVPVALVLWLVGTTLLGTRVGTATWLGLLAGFLHYEYFHWRIHFRLPRTERERLLRSHHLAHHFRRPRHYHGVTTRLWDRVFGTLPETWAADYDSVADRPPLPGRSNLGVIWTGGLMGRSSHRH